MIQETIIVNSYWFWLTLSGVLLALEILGAGVCLLCSSVAAFLVGLLVLLLPLGWELQSITFALLTILIAWLWSYYLQANARKHPSLVLNQRDKQLIGTCIHLDEPLVNGIIRLRIGDSTWRAEVVEKIPAGSLVEIFAVEGITLRIRCTTEH